MRKLFLLPLFASVTLAAGASTLTFTPSSQTIAVGGSATVDVSLSGLAAGQALGAFDLFVTDNAAILSPTSVTFFDSLGNPALELTASTLSPSEIEAAEVSFETTATLLALQTATPFDLFSITYTGLAAGTSTITLDTTTEYLADGNGVILPDATIDPAAITVTGGTPPPAVTPEPSSLALLGTGLTVEHLPDAHSLFLYLHSQRRETKRRFDPQGPPLH